MKDDLVYVLHILDLIRRIFDYTAEGEEGFLSIEKTQVAVIRNLEIISESAENISPDLKNNHGDIPWKQIGGMRKMLNHDHFEIDLTLVWGVVVKDLPELERKLRSILKRSGP